VEEESVEAEDDADERTDETVEAAWDSVM